MAFTATLLSALVATIVAPLAMATVSVTSAGAVPRGGTSTGTASFTFTEQADGVLTAANCFYSSPSDGALPYPNPAIVVQIKDALAGATVGFSGTPVVTAPGSLGATASLSAAGGHTGDTLTINFVNSDDLNPEQVTVSGLAITADTGAAPGAIVAKIIAGSQAHCIVPQPATVLATGNLAGGPYGAPNTGPFSIVLGASSCPFAVTTPVTFSPNSKLNFLTNAESKAINAVGAVVAGVQPVSTVGDPTANNHFAGEAVTQTVTNCNPFAFPVTIGSPGTVTAAFTVTSGGTPAVNPGENSQVTGASPVAAADITITDTAAGPGSGILFTGETITFAITTPATGVVFSAPFTVTPSADISLGLGAGVSVPCSLSVDRHFCSVVVASDAAGPTGTVTASNILVDVDATVPLGTAVKVTVTTSPAVATTGSPVTIAYVGRVIVSTGAQPTIYIGFNDQATGTITLVESGPGFFVAGTGGNNTFGICMETGESFTRAPWAVVTTGDLKILSGLVGVTQLKGTLFTDTDGGTANESCAYWTIYSASTVASTIEIRGSADDVNPLPAGVNNGPRLSVPKTGFGATPGSTQADLLVGTLLQVMNDGGFSTEISNAIRAFKNSFAIAAVSQPVCAPGATDCLGGNITITETQNGQLKPGDLITVRVLPRSSTQRQDVILKTGNTNDLPIVTANTAASGLLVTPVGVNCPPSALLGTIVCQFTFSVTQQSFGPTLGQITISNIHYVLTADAILGPVNVEVTNTPGPGGQSADTVISNMTIGNPAALTKVSSASAIGKTNNAASFSVGTKVIHLVASSNNIATIRLKLDPALVGKSVQIQVATKNSAGVWSAFVTLTTRVVGSDGYAYYYASQHTPAWKSFRGNFAGTPQWQPSHSQTVQVRWVN